MKRRVGRPRLYSQELSNEVCRRLARGRSLRSVCRDDDMPDETVIFDWFRQYPEFTQQYTRATEERTEAQQEDLLEMGDKAIEHAEEADPKAANAIVSAYKLKADNLKWSMSKMKPKKFGDKLDMTTDGKALPTPILGGLTLSNNAILIDNHGPKDNRPTESS